MDEKEKLEHIKEQIGVEQMFDLLLTLGADPIIKGDFIMCRTICHGGSSHKLYYYDNTKLFRCYTECSDTFDIFQLVVKLNSTDGRNYPLPKAIDYVCNYFNIEQENQNFSEEQTELQDWKIFNRYDKILNKENKEERKVEMKIYDDKI